MESFNPIYEGAVYETPPGESLKSLLPPTSPQDSTHHYIEQPPTLPPPRGQGATEPMDEIDAIKTFIKQSELPQIPESGTGDVYVTMGPNNTTSMANNMANGKGVSPHQL